MPLNPEADDRSVFGDAFSSIAGFTQKAVIEIGDMTEVKVKKIDAPKPTAGSGSSLGKITAGDLNSGAFSMDAVKNFAAASVGASVEGGDSFEVYGNIKKYRFEVQFNPDEIYINGYGGEELPIHNFDKRNPKHEHQEEEKKDDSKKKPDENEIFKGSSMASANTRIDMSFKIAFDKSNPQDASFADKFTLSQTNIAKGALRAGLKAAGKMSNSVQPEVEALTALVRSGNKRLTRFIWGDMAYEGVLNSVNAEYVMFNCNGEPCRAFVSLNMVLYDADVAGANTDIWQMEYQRDVYSLSKGSLAGSLSSGKLPSSNPFSNMAI